MPQQLSEKCLFDTFGSHNYGKNLSQYAKLMQLKPWRVLEKSSLYCNDNEM